MDSKTRNEPKKTKRRHIAIVFLGISFIAVSEFGYLDKYYVKLTLFTLAAFEGTAYQFQGYQIPTFFRHIVSESYDGSEAHFIRINEKYSGYNEDYFLTVGIDSSSEVARARRFCSRNITSCKSIVRENYHALSTRTYIESNDEFIDRTIYTKVGCDIYFSHLGKPFRDEYKELIDEFYLKECSANS